MSGRGGEQNCSGPIAWAFLKTSRDAPINTVRVDSGGAEGSTRLSLYFPTYRHIRIHGDRTIDITETWWNARHYHRTLILSRNSDLQDCFINVSRFPRPLLQPFLGTTRPRAPFSSVSGTTSPITLRFNSLYHYLRAQKVNATLITMFNSSTSPPSDRLFYRRSFSHFARNSI